MTGIDLSGWGRFPVVAGREAVPASWRAVQSLVAGPDPVAPRGLGRSYGDSALPVAEGVAVTGTALDRILGFDPETGIVDCEGGVSLDLLITTFLPRGFFLPTTPGTRFVTVAGAIAADVHGKDHHRAGSFGAHVLDLTLATPDGGLVVCGPDRDAELFHATVGGMGLTGWILRASVRLKRVPSAFFRVRYRRAESLAAAMRILGAAEDAAYTVAWIDGLAQGRHLGRSVCMLGDDAVPADLPPAWRDRPHHRPAKRTRAVPVDFPGWALSPPTVRAFNGLYYATHGDADRIVDWESFFYPLDAVRHWNRIYGRRGFAQFQALFPDATAEAGLSQVLERIGAAGAASFLAVLKRSGAAGPAPLSFLFRGWTLALDLPNTGEPLVRLLADLEGILLRHGGRIYLAKDAVCTRAAFATMYPRLGEWQAVKARIDPRCRLRTRQSDRIGLTP